jgi:hypothetical protein
MAILMQMRAPEWTKEQYDALHDAMVLGGTLPAGCLFHVSTPLPGGGFQVIDVWESAEALNRFNEQTVMPAAQRIGIPQPNQEPQILEVNEYMLR